MGVGGEPQKLENSNVIYKFHVYVLKLSTGERVFGGYHQPLPFRLKGVGGFAMMHKL